MTWTSTGSMHTATCFTGRCSTFARSRGCLTEDSGLARSFGGVTYPVCELAEWLHNMAAFSRRDFADFDEERFWDEFERLRAKHPDFKYYRSMFLNALVESQTGHWPSVEEQRKRDA
jgi:hypothetical protein